MSDLRTHCRWLLRSYPVAYRQLRGVEIVETLVDVSRPGATWPPLLEIAVMVAAGTRRRLGLAADQPLGGFAELIAGWYLALATTLAASAILIGELSPWASVVPRPPTGFGPFATDGVVVYAAIVLAALAATLQRTTLARALAIAAFALSGAMFVAEHLISSWNRPPLSFLIPVLVCLVPTVVRPRAGQRRPRPHDQTMARLATMSAVAAPVWLGLVDIYLDHKYRYGNFWTGRGSDFYRLVLGVVARWIPFVGIAVLMAAVVLLALNLRSLAVGIMTIMAPWLLLAVLVTGAPIGADPLRTMTRTTPDDAIVVAGFIAMAVWLGSRKAPARSTE